MNSNVIFADSSIIIPEPVSLPSNFRPHVTQNNHHHYDKKTGKYLGSYMYEELLGKFGGCFFAEHYNKFGKLLNKFKFRNAVTDLGLNNLLDAYFGGVTQTTTWYLGLIDNASYTAIANADTMAVHAGWLEFEDYSESNRVTWVEGAAAGRSITNATPGTFTISGAGTLRGAFLASNNTKGGTTGLLWAHGLFGATYPVNIADEFKLTYTVSG